MAGIEKICEYSGDYEGGKMYKCKRNSIQVLPQHLHNFKNELAVLIFFSQPELRNYTSDKPDVYLYFHFPFWMACKLPQKWKEFIWKLEPIMIPKFWTRDYWIVNKYGYFYKVPTMVWDYCLYVPSLQGNIEGKYFNTTSNPKKTIKKLYKICDIINVDTYSSTMRDHDKYYKDRNETDPLWEDIEKYIIDQRELDEKSGWNDASRFRKWIDRMVFKFNKRKSL